MHLAALKSLKTEISDLTKQLQLANEKNDVLETSINQIKVKLTFYKYLLIYFIIKNYKIIFNYNSITVQVATEIDIKQKYEERITELHSVIAELARKLQVQRSQVITEEIEESQSGNIAWNFCFFVNYLKKIFILLEIDGQSIETSSFIQESIVLSKEVCTKDILL